MLKKIRDYGFHIGNLPTGKNNSITDVPGVTVGHVTLDEYNSKTGVTAILPHGGNLFKEKVIGASHIINGFGKSTGLIQIDELGTIESPIILTNTLNVGTAHEGLVQYMLDTNEDIGISTGSVNPIICECNDGELNHIRDLHVKSHHVFDAIKNASEIFQEGNVGAGTGMICYNLKGGIGSASRIINLDGKEYTIGILVLSNFGSLEDFRLGGNHIGPVISNLIQDLNKREEQGSIITILATDIPLSSRQLKRVIKRIYPGISRTGSFTSNGSGEVCIGFSTANIINHYEDKDLIDIKVINENKIDQIFKAAVEATEEAILNSMICSSTTIGRDNKKIYSLVDFIDKIHGPAKLTLTN
jgi:D-aminopeptidase